MSENQDNIENNVLFKLGKLENITQQHSKDIDKLKEISQEIPSIKKDVRDIQQTLNKINNTFSNFDSRIDVKFDNISDKLLVVNDNVDKLKDDLTDKIYNTRKDIENAKVGWKVIVTVTTIIISSIGLFATIKGFI